jgi:hypothetical protein
MFPVCFAAKDIWNKAFCPSSLILGLHIFFSQKLMGRNGNFVNERSRRNS